jgi:endonuclease/exonuclease/phosphatase family metal-dependent hydrolase
VPGPICEGERCGFGNALLTRVPFGEVRNHNLSVPGREMRAALDVDLNTVQGRVRVVSTHLGLSRDERRLQVAQLVTILDADKEAPSLLLGDFNEWRRSDPSLRPLALRMGPAPRGRSFPARLPAFCLDRVWAKPSNALLHLRVHQSPLARIASDHLPVVAAISLDRTA